MKVSERIALIQKISGEIQDRYDWAEAALFLGAFHPKAHTYFDDYDSVRIMASHNLGQVDVSVLGEIVDDLGLEAIGHLSAQVQRPKTWQDTDKFRIFISHISVDKTNATRLRDALNKYNICAFVAHEDIEPTLEWQVQIERALHSMEAYVSIHTKGYDDSTWCQQETGFAVGSGTKVIALRMGEDPTGFISKHQAISRGVKKAEDVAAEIDGLLRADDRTKTRYLECNKSNNGYEELDDDDIPF